MINLENYSKLFKNDKGIKNVTIEFLLGNIYGLVGPNGSGKTTLLNSITGFSKGKGLIEVNGNTKRDLFLKDISYMPDEEYLLSGKIKDIGIVAEILSDDFDNELFQSYITDFGIELDHSFTKLSKGQKMSVKIAYTLARNTSIYIFDEPLSGIDIVTRKAILSEIMNKANENTMIIISSHELHDLDNKVDQIVFLDEGEIIEVVSLDDLKEEFEKELSEIYITRFQKKVE